MVQIIKKISPYNHSSGNNVQYIVIHSTGNTNDTAKNNADYFYRADRQASAHYFVDDNYIYQVVEESNAAWHCGDGGMRYGIGNHNSIGIEMCGTANGHISDKTINNTIELVKALQRRYGLSNDRVVRHYDASRKNCPSQFSPNNWARWTDFKKRLVGNKATTSVNNVKIATDYLQTKQNIKNVQKLLQLCGYKFNVIDGVCGSKTTGYIADFQKKHGLGVDYKFGPKSIGIALDIIKNKIK